MVTLDEVISEIDDYIKTIIQDMINFRSKRLEASSKVLDKLKALMEAVTYMYRLGELYDKVIKVETDKVKTYDIQRPRLRIKYTGALTKLFTDTTYIEVPEVPVFKWEPITSGYAVSETAVEHLRRNIVVKLPVDVNVAEPPDMENAFGKYFYMNYAGFSHDYLVWEIFVGKKITMIGMIMEIQKILTYL